MPEAALRVIAPDVGGAFGMKSQIYPEEALVVWAAAKLKRPVKWTGERAECIACDTHGRHQIAQAAMAFDAEGRILALRTSVDVDLGAYLGNSAGVPPLNAAVSYPGTYDIPLIHAASRGVFTNTSTTGPYRGSGKPEATFVVERLIDKAAREMNIDPVAFRRRNLIRPAAMPYKTAGSNVYDCGDFERVMDAALGLAAWDVSPRAVPIANGAGVAAASASPCTASAPAANRSGWKSAFLPTAALSFIRGHWPPGKATKRCSRKCSASGSEFRLKMCASSRAIPTMRCSAAEPLPSAAPAPGLRAQTCGHEVVQKGKRLSAWMLEAAEADIEFDRGVFRIKGTDRHLSLKEVAKAAYNGAGFPQGFGIGLKRRR